MREHQQGADIQFGLALGAMAQQRLTALLETPVQAGQEIERFMAEDIAIAGLKMAQDFDAARCNL